MNRYQNSNILKDSKGVRYLSITKYPTIPLSDNDIYINSTLGDRVDILASKYYGDHSLWWVISIANNMPRDSFHFPNGSQVRIPQNINKILNDFKNLNS